MKLENTSTPMWIRPNDLDSLRHLNNASALELLENARWHWMAKNGLAPQQRVIAVVARSEVDYRRQVACRKVVVRTAIEDPPEDDDVAFQVTFLQSIYPSTDEVTEHAAAIEARIQIGFVDVETGSLTTARNFFEASQA